MLKALDRFINGITMYRLMHYGLIALAGVSFVFGAIGLLPFTLVQLLVSSSLIAVVCIGTNFVFAKILRAPINRVSAQITALILFLILPPAATVRDGMELAVVAAVAMLSKYVLAIGKKHLFNPAAVGAVFASFVFFYDATWWVGSKSLLPFVLVFGVLVIRKLRRSHLFFSFLIVSVVTLVWVGVGATSGGWTIANVVELLRQSFYSWPVIFFASVMLVEPLTTPPTRNLQMLYGAIVGLLFGSSLHVGSVYATPEIALLIGNVFSYMVSPKQKLFLKFKERVTLAPDIYQFSFAAAGPLSFRPGQYMEWTLPHAKPDSRGERRYFTVASAPSEQEVRIGVKVAGAASTFKKTLLNLKAGETVVASQVAGDFTLPADASTKLAFIAGGIGVTPFHSMVRYLLDTNQKRDIVLFYACVSPADFAYKELFDEANEKIGLKTVYIVTDKQKAPPEWVGRTGFIDNAMLKDAAPDFQKRAFFLSGPSAMVTNYKKLLLSSGVARRNIHTDYFPGY